ncbi:unnamed protein product [Rotaria socialis]|uniref:Doublecortin domain-containing protein n=1 Tax=Rotaria socialis TaxID=392032 RepID=A0A818L7A9_9BILA|nr:unnamed protein product [Rotaria socialis]CAF3773883.1 unnamed protein product [Rotaria socialis]
MMAEYDQQHGQHGYQKHGQNDYQSPSHSGYQPPINNGYQPPINNGYQPSSHSGYQPPINNGYQPPSHSGYQPPVNNGYQPPSNSGYQQRDQRGYQQYDQRGYQQQDQQAYDPRDQQQSQARSTILERGRAIRLMRNGDSFFTGRNFVINQKKYPMLDVFLDDASRTLRANFGAVRCIYTPKHGTQLQDISDFEDHRTYVAAGGEKFKKLHYLDIAEGKRVSSKGQSSPKVHLLPPVRRVDVEGRALKLSRSENLIIYVYRNGDPLTLPAKVLLVKSTLQSWESVLDEITKKVSLSNTAVLKLYAMNGELVTSARQIEYNAMYVAAGKERFKRIEYPDLQLISPNASPKASRKSSSYQTPDVPSRTRLPPLQTKTVHPDAHHSAHQSASVMQQRYAKSDGANTYTNTNTANSYGSTENPSQRRPAREDYDFFNNKPQPQPQQHRRGPTKETDLDRDDGGIYKGRLNHRERVHEVDETRDTKIDFPVDYREAETVEEESLYGNARKNPDHRHLQPHNQPFVDARQHPIKSQTKSYDDDDDYQHPYATSRSNGYENDYSHRPETPIDDDQTEQQLPHSSYRKPLISSSTQNQPATHIQYYVRRYFTCKQTQHDDQQQQQQVQDMESNIDEDNQSTKVSEHNYDDNHYKT